MRDRRADTVWSVVVACLIVGTAWVMLLLVRAR